MAEQNVVDAAALPQIVTRAEAKAQGLKRYFDGVPCIRGHIATRTTNNALCWDCYRVREAHKSAAIHARNTAGRIALQETFGGREILQRSEAKARNLSRYSPGKPCKYGHMDDFMTFNGCCETCYRAKYRKKNATRPGFGNTRLERQHARENGEKYYWTGRKCRHGHLAERETSTGICVTCLPDHWLRGGRNYRARLGMLPRTQSRKAAKLSGALTYRSNRPCKRKHKADRYTTSGECVKCSPIEARAYCKKFPERAKDASHKRRVRKMGGMIGDAKALMVFMKHIRHVERVRCYWCKKNVPKSKRHADHIIPLDKGGQHTAANLCVSCARCNLRKNAKMPEVFAGQAELSFAA